MMKAKFKVGDLVTCEFAAAEMKHIGLLLRQYSWPSGWIVLIDGREWKVPEELITRKVEHESR